MRNGNEETMIMNTYTCIKIFRANNFEHLQLQKAVMKL